MQHNDLIFAHRHTSLFYCASQILHFFFFFTNGRFVANPCEQGCQCHFPKASPLFVFLCPVLVLLSMFPTFSLLLNLLGWCAISDLWCFCTVIVLGCHGPYPQKTGTSWISVCAVSAALTGRYWPLSSSLGLRLFRDTAVLKLGQLIALQWPLVFKWKEDPHLSHLK